MPLDILHEIGQTYGPTRKLHQVLATLVTATIENLERSRNRPDGHAVALGSPTTSMIPQAMQLPMRIDHGLQLSSTDSSVFFSSPVVKVETPSQHRVPSMSDATASWHEGSDGLHAVPVNGIQDSNPLSDMSAQMESARFSPADSFDNSMLWAPSLDWTGGWDDFLNAIAM